MKEAIEVIWRGSGQICMLLAKADLSYSSRMDITHLVQELQKLGIPAA